MCCEQLGAGQPVSAIATALGCDWNTANAAGHFPARVVMPCRGGATSPFCSGDRQGKLLTPNRKRAAVTLLCARFGVSERRACTVAGQHRSTQRLDGAVHDEAELRLRAWLRAFATRRPRWGRRRAWAQARREGWEEVNRKRIQRLWREEGLRVPYRRRKKPLRGVGTHLGAMCPIALWAADFQFDQTDDPRPLKL